MRGVWGGTLYWDTGRKQGGGEGGGGGREQEEELPHPAPPRPTQPSRQNKDSPCGKQVRLGWVVGWEWKHDVARHEGHHTYSEERRAAPHWWRFLEEDLVCRWRVTHGWVGCVSCILNTLEWFPLRHARGHKMWCTYPEFNIYRNVQPRMWSTKTHHRE